MYFKEKLYFDNSILVSVPIRIPTIEGTMSHSNVIAEILVRNRLSNECVYLL